MYMLDVKKNLIYEIFVQWQLHMTTGWINYGSKLSVTTGNYHEVILSNRIGDCKM